ncbi:hypothetical protein PHYSODRAFT_486780, partial [Phytophthora sojae]
FRPSDRSFAVGLSQQNAQMYQDFQAQLHAYQQQLQQHVAVPQPPREYRLEGVTMPTFYGKPTESVDDQQRVIAILAANLREGAASWYHAQVAIDHIRFNDEFRLRAELKACRQRSSVEEYVDRFCDGLKSEIRKEVMYLRYRTLAKAISAAQAFERTHFHSSERNRASSNSRNHGNAHRAATDGPTPMDVSAVYTRSISKEQYRRQNLCFYCKGSGHRIGQCPHRKPARGQQHQGNDSARRM